MHRRAFVTSALSTVALAGLAEQLPRPGTAFVVPAGADRQQQPLVLGGRTPTHRKVSAQDSAGALYLFEHRDMGRGGPARHVHFEQDEWFYAVAGAFAIEIGAERFHLNPGDLAFAPRNVPHVWACTSDAPGTILIGLHPALTIGRFFERLGALSSPPRGDALAALFADHGMKVVGPPLELR